MPTRLEIENALTPKGGYTRQQLAEWGVPWPPSKGWKKDLLMSNSNQGEKSPTDLDKA